MLEIIRLLKKRDVLFLYLGQMLSSIGNWFFRIALPLIVYNTTKSPLYVSITVISSTVPFFLFAPLGGVISDRVNRRKILLIADFMRAIIFFALVLCPASYIVELLIIGGFFVAVCDRFFSPSILAIQPNLVKKDELALLNSLFSMSQTFLKLTVPPVAALVTGFVGYRAALLINSISFGASVIGIILISSKAFAINVKETKLNAVSIIRDLKEGFDELLKLRPVYSAILIWMIVWIGSAPYTTLLIVFIKEILNGSDAAFGIISSFNAVGMILGGSCAIYLSKKVKIWNVFVVGLFLISGASILFAFSSHMYVAYLARFIAGVGSMIASIAEITILQNYIPTSLRGRIFSFSEMALQGISIVSMSIASLLIIHFDLKTLFYGSSFIFVLASFIALIMSDRIFAVSSRNERTCDAETAQ